ncbi:MAG TPA: Asp-tRNA(Asn)/Glu-tRNA(Gln) amidotransferase subunit GatA [Rhabdochlamydiaceae bacterium]|nr:Asp-tRNA(Asn)/Glu-tRNA(Gln) amidotransferase subunit GatA [Rhabdochlamydiaceae bacterium]
MYRLPAHILTERFRKGESSAEKIIETFLKRIHHFDSKLGSFLSVLSERAMTKAKELDHKRKMNQPLGKLAGVPIGIKDNIHIKGEKTTCGSQFLTNYHALFDATVVRLLEEEDAILIGKNNMDEFAMGSSGEHSAFFPTKNPWNLDCSPGGSSSGPAAAVSARLCPLALGSDTGGSIRQPAAFSGIVGIKPTYGRVSRSGLVAFASSLDQIGPLTTNVHDAALVMEVIAKHDMLDSTSYDTPPVAYLEMMQRPIKGETIGVPFSFLENLSEENKVNFNASLEIFKQLGAKIVEVDLDILKYAIATYYILATAEASTNLARFDGIAKGNRSPKAGTIEEVYNFSRQEGFGEEVKNRILLGTFVLSSGYQDEYYKKAQKVRTLIIEQFRKAFATCSVIALPTTPTTAFPLGNCQDPLKEYLQDLYTISVNLAGLPGISIPSGFDSENKPFGLQLLGAQLHDAEVFRFAYAFEQATPFHRSIPKMFDKEVL